MSALGGTQPSDEEEIVLVFRPPENPAAQIAGITPFKGLRLKLDELLDWFQGLNVDSIELWIEGAWKTENHTELFLSLEGKTGAKVTLKPPPRMAQTSLTRAKIRGTALAGTPHSPSEESQTSATRTEQSAKPSTLTITALFSPGGGIERQIVSMIAGAFQSIEMAAYDFTNETISNAILDAIMRGVKVSIVLDRTETKGQQARLHDVLERAGTEIRLISPSGGIMHDKFIVVDGKTVEWGSYNYTERAEDVNFENATFLTDVELARQYHSDFAFIFNEATPEVRGLGRTFRRFFRHFVPKAGQD